MAVFVVFRVSRPEKMELAIQAEFPNDHYKLQSDEWLVSAVGTAKEISDKLNITPDQETGSGIVFSMANYYGRAPTEIWDWIKSKAESSGG